MTPDDRPPTAAARPPPERSAARPAGGAQTFLLDLDDWVRGARGRARRARRGRAGGRSRRRDRLRHVLSLAVWKAVAERYQLLKATFDGGRVGSGRARAALHAGLGPAGRRPRRGLAVAARGLPALRRAGRRRCARGSRWRPGPTRQRGPGPATCGPSSSGSATRWASSRRSPATTPSTGSPRCGPPRDITERARAAPTWRPAPAARAGRRHLRARPHRRQRAPPRRPATRCSPPAAPRRARAARGRAPPLADAASAPSTPPRATPCPTSTRSARCPTPPPPSRPTVDRLERVAQALGLAESAYAAALAEHRRLLDLLDALRAKADAHGARPTARDLAASERRPATVLARRAGADGRRPAAGGDLPDLARPALARSPHERPRRCTQPGCTGSIRTATATSAAWPATPAAPPPVPATATPARGPGDRTAADGGRLPQPGCTGTILDGYCDVCGMAAEPVGAAAVRRRRAPTPTARRRRLVGDVGQPDRSPAARLGSRRAGTSATRRARSGSQRMRAARLGAGLTVRARRRPSSTPRKAVIADPPVPEDKRTCSKCGTPIGRGRDGKPGPHRGLLPAVRPGVLLHAQAAGRRPRRRAVRGRRRHRPRRPRLDLPRPATATSPTAGSCSRACSTPATPTRSPPRSPSSSSSPRSSTR